MNNIFCNYRDRVPIFEWCLNEMLKLPNYDIIVLYQYLCSRGGYFDRPNHVVISQSYTFQPEDIRDETRTIFHELRHYYQFRNHMWDFNPTPYQRDYSKMDEKLKGLEMYLDYLNYPWELDANEFAMEACNQFWKTDLSEKYKYVPKPKPIWARAINAVGNKAVDFVFEAVQAEPSYPSFYGEISDTYKT